MKIHSYFTPLCLILCACLCLTFGCRRKTRKQRLASKEAQVAQLTFKGLEITATSAVKADLVKQLGQYLIKTQFADGASRRLKIDQRKGAYLIELEAIKVNDLAPFRAFAAELSREVFKQAPVDFILMNAQGRPLGVAQMYLFGTRSQFGEVELFSSPEIKTPRLKALGQYLEQTHFTGKSPVSVQLTRSKTGYQFKMVLKSGVKAQEHQATFKSLLAELKRSIFKSEPLELHLCDDEFKTLSVIR